MAAAKKPRKPREMNLPAPDVTQKDITDDLLPDGIPTLSDGTVSEDVLMTEESMRKLGAADVESAKHNQAEAEFIKRQRNGEKNVRFGDTDPLAKYETTVKTFGSERLVANIKRVDPPPDVDLPPMTCSHIRTGQQLYEVIARNYHRQSPAATYLIRIRESGVDRCQLRLSLPDTNMTTAPSALPWQQQPQQGYQQGGGFPVGGGGFPQQGYPQVPPGYMLVPQAAPEQSPTPPAPAPVPQQQLQPQYGPPAPIFVQQPVAPPPAADPAQQAWMGAMYQAQQQQAATLAELMQRLDRTSQGDQAKVTQFIEDLRAGRVQLPGAPAATQPAPAPPGWPSLQGSPPAAPAAAQPFPQYQPPPPPLQNPFESMAALPRPGWWPSTAAWPPDPRDPSYWQLSAQLHPQPQMMAPPPPPPPPPPVLPVAPPPPPPNPFDEVRRSFEMVASLVNLSDRMRGTAPSIGTGETAPLAPVTPEPVPPRVEIMKVGGMDVAIRPESGDIHWVHTLIGAAPKIFDFMGKFAKEASLVARTHAVTDAVQSGKMPVQYIPPQYQPAPQPQFQPAPLPQAQQPFYQAIPVAPEPQPAAPVAVVEQEQAPVIEHRVQPSPMKSIWG